jgi:hypothetical protein
MLAYNYFFNLQKHQNILQIYILKKKNLNLIEDYVSFILLNFHYIIKCNGM